ncbi:hypothetical protein CYMTET_50380 [Cymbomonas tetramitiformis]|uniref:EF-hand domain-containing protein n=1 Tax=Cymbomonas tetramitiformis TaxID=36881 RepID=A0AAE0EUT6_9CHLO|nr:hypothetical protein CYMTET_50380 [Cymbomonas tetramitiformis]
MTTAHGSNLWGPGYNTTGNNLSSIKKDEETEMRIGATFRHYDLDESGSLGFKEMKTFLIELGLIHKDDGALRAFVEAEIAKADANKDGRLHLAEFTAYYTDCLPAKRRPKEADEGPGSGSGHHQQRTTDFMATSCKSIHHASSAEAKEAALLTYLQELRSDVASDYSKSFAGTAADTALERGIAQLMRGGIQDAEQLAFPVMACPCQLPGDTEHTKECTGKWLRALNRQSGCYLYVHTNTNVVTSKRPCGFYDPEEERRNALLLAVGEYPSFTSCFLENLDDVVRDVIAEHGKTPLLLTGSEEVFAETLEWLKQPVGAFCKQKKPLFRGYLVDTRPMALGASRTGVKLEDSAKAAKAKLCRALRVGGLCVVEVADQPPHFAERICKRFYNMFPVQVFDPKAKGWRKDLLGFDPPSGDGPEFRLAVLSSSGPSNYERELKDPLFPEPWGRLHPVHVRCTPVEVVNMRDMVEGISAATAQNRVPLLLDATANKGTVDTFFKYQRAFVIDMQVDVDSRLALGEPTMSANGSLSPAALEVLEGWRKKLVNAMKQGYYLCVSLLMSTTEFIREYCHDDYFPAAVFQCGEIQQQKWLEKVVRPEDKEHGVFVIREGFHVVVTSLCPIESYKQNLKICLPLRKMKD